VISKMAGYGIIAVFVATMISVYANDIDSRDSVEFILDISKYKGLTIDSVLHDIGYQPDDSAVNYFVYASGEIIYMGCKFRFPNGVFLHLDFDNIIPQPPDRVEIIRDANYFMREKVGDITVSIDCSMIDSLKIQ